ncbi:uncharacterized protein TRIVIDRAFT_206868 [Trichoderma virens Gv29-8]|uniref:Uncharacterized protein n=1 Tax=Hypocrea virens (strain Gv29-8 / FGSC 10586) TaxID=413071 RepID=G9NBM1_HYPVG|nr:uncharacterized protein TRIVIDRAFT_206868 [Trichoderma virens Gv29-8]EHK16226.1 hypothetical protein TRIVIDRAFT_206868 [Trichoderma virens Gv29-8]
MLQMEQSWHVVAIQDPPPEIIWSLSEVRRTHHLWYQSLRFVTENDHRMLREDGAAAPQLQAKVAFLVSREIPETDWRVTVPDWGNNMLATLLLNGPFGVINIHNIYRIDPIDKTRRLDMVELVGNCYSRPNRKLGLWFCWDRAKKEEYCKMVADGLEALSVPNLDEPDGIDIHLSLITKVLVKAVSKTVPASLTCKLPRPMGRPQQGKKKESQDDKTKEPQEEKVMEPRAEKATELQEERGDEHRIQPAYKEAPFEPLSNPTIWNLSKQPKRRAKPADLPYTPDFQFSGKCATTGKEKSIMYMDAIYGQGKTSKTSSTHPRLPENLDCIVPAESKLALGDQGPIARQGEVSALIAALPTKKSAGIDILDNEALIMAREIISPYLEKVFNGCIENCYYLTYCKLSKTTYIYFIPYFQNPRKRPTTKSRIVQLLFFQIWAKSLSD